jgi:hypothetical protein
MKTKSFVERNPVRVAAWVSSTVAIVVAFLLPEMPVEPAVAFVLSSLGLGEFAQRKENVKTDCALYSMPPEEE